MSNLQIVYDPANMNAVVAAAVLYSDLRPMLNTAEEKLKVKINTSGNVSYRTTGIEEIHWIGTEPSKQDLESFNLFPQVVLQHAIYHTPSSGEYFQTVTTDGYEEIEGDTHESTILTRLMSSMGILDDKTLGVNYKFIILLKEFLSGKKLEIKELEEVYHVWRKSMAFLHGVVFPSYKQFQAQLKLNLTQNTLFKETEEYGIIPVIRIDEHMLPWAIRRVSYSHKSFLLISPTSDGERKIQVHEGVVSDLGV